MDVYQYITANYPVQARKLLIKYGYNPPKMIVMPEYLRSAVASKKMPFFREMMELHPDKDVILELFSNPSNSLHASFDGPGISDRPDTSGCKCGSCQKNSYANADGNASNNNNQASDATKLAMQTNTIIIASAFLLAFALIAPKMK